MKKYILLFTILVSFFYSCEHEKLDTYESVDRVYFDQNNKTNPLPDSMYINLITRDGEIAFLDETEVEIPVKLMGMLSETDRKFSVIQADESYVKNIESLRRGCDEAVINQDFEILSSIIPANKEKGMLKIKLKNSTRLQEKGDTLVASLYIVENEHFSTDYSATNAPTSSNDKPKENLLYRIFFYSDRYEAPRMWYYSFKDPTERRRDRLNGGIPMYLGVYTPEKFQLFLDATGLTANLFEFTDDEYALVNEGSTTITADGTMKVFAERFGTKDIFSRWRSQVQLYLLIHPERYDDFPNSTIEWAARKMFEGPDNGNAWGEWKKPE